MLASNLSLSSFVKGEDSVTEYLQRMARYNQWANRRLFEKVAQLPAEAIQDDRGAFFGSILGTLNHIFVADILWLSRFGTCEACLPLQPISILPPPKTLRDILFPEINDFIAGRERLDELIVDFGNMLTPELLHETIRYRNMAGEEHEGLLGSLVQHLFNHQTHHRGQVTNMLFQAGIDPGALDLLVMIMEEGE